MLWLVFVLLGLSFPALAQTEQVLVIANRNSPVSQRIAQYYLKRRAIPRDQLFLVSLPDSNKNTDQETINYALYQTKVEQPLRQFLKQSKQGTKYNYIVLTKGIPIRIRDVLRSLVNNPKYRQVQSLDSTLAAMDTQSPQLTLTSRRQILGVVNPNPFWQQTIPFDHQKWGGYLVTRLDGQTEAQAKALVDRALIPRPVLQGQVLLDKARGDQGSLRSQPVDLTATCPLGLPLLCESSFGVTDQDYNADLELAGQTITKMFPQLLVQQAPPQTFVTAQNLIAYASWGSNDQYFSLKVYQELRFRPGGIADTAVSTSARTLLPTQGGQSLITNLVSQGVTGVRGYTDEPYLMAVTSPSVLITHYLTGSNLATAFYRGLRFIGWRDLVLGDPLAMAVNQ